MNQRMWPSRSALVGLSLLVVAPVPSGRRALVLPAEVGVFALADVGRVFLEGEDSDEWHPGYGGGLWLSYLDRKNTFSITVAESEGRALLYIRLGFAF